MANFSYLRYRSTKSTSASDTKLDSNSGRASIEGASTVNIPSDTIVTKLPPLSEPLLGLPSVQYASVRAEDNQTQVTTLSNGLRVASEKRFGQFSTVGGNFFVFFCERTLVKQI